MKPKEYYEEMFKAHQLELAAQLARLRAKRWEIQKDAEREFDEQVDRLRQMAEEAEQRTRKFFDAGQESWRDMEENMSSAYESVVSATERALARFSQAALSKESGAGETKKGGKKPR